MMSVKLRSALMPLYFVSKVLCIHPFSLNPLKSSPSGSILAVMMAIGYSIFHLMSASTDYVSDSEDGEKANLVGVIIDAYNRYSGFCAFCLLIAASICVQSHIVAAIRQLEDVDALFYRTYRLEVDNSKWRT